MPSVVGEANSMLAHAIAIMALVVGASLVCGLCNVFEETGGCIIAMGCGACGMVCLGLRKWDDAFKEACEKGYARFAGVVAVEYGAV